MVQSSAKPANDDDFLLRQVSKWLWSGARSPNNSVGYSTQALHEVGGVLIANMLNWHILHQLSNASSTIINCRTREAQNSRTSSRIESKSPLMRSGL